MSRACHIDPKFKSALPPVNLILKMCHTIRHAVCHTFGHTLRNITTRLRLAVFRLGVSQLGTVDGLSTERARLVVHVKRLR